MRKWISPTLTALLLGTGLPAALFAQAPAPAPAAPAPAPPAAAVPVTPAPAAPARVVTVDAAVQIPGDPYHAATPYNPTVVGRSVPNPAWNRPNFTLPCDIPNQNLAPLILTPPEILQKLFGRTKGCGGGCGSGCGTGGGCGSGGCGNAGGCGNGGCGSTGGCDGGCGAAKPVIRMSGHGLDESDCDCHNGSKKGMLGRLCDKVTGRCDAACNAGGSCTTCCNAYIMFWASSRTFFGESSRSFFERPPSVDGVKHPKKDRPGAPAQPPVVTTEYAAP